MISMLSAARLFLLAQWPHKGEVSSSKEPSLAIKAALVACCGVGFLASMYCGRGHGPASDESKSTTTGQGRVSTIPGFSVQILERVTIASSRRYCWFPTIHLFASGDLLATMRLSPDEVYPEGEISAFTLSSDGGRSWSRRFPLGAGGNADAAYGQPQGDDLFVLGSGYNAAEPDPTGQTKRFRVVLTRFSRDGMQLDQRRDAILELRQAAARDPEHEAGQKDSPERVVEVPQVQPWGSIIRGQNGDWLTTVYYKIEPDPRSTRVVVVRSSDEGLTWRESGLIAGVPAGEKPWDWIGDEGPTETAMVRLADGQLFVLYRTGGVMGEGWSRDDGRTWTSAHPTAFRGVAPRLRRLANGMLACTFGRPGPVSIVFNADGSGRDWSNLTEIYNGRTTAYSDFVEVSPGRMFVIYDNVPYGWKPIPPNDEHARNTILGAVLALSKK